MMDSLGGEETEDGIMHNKVPYFTINISCLILFTKCVIIEINIVFCKTCLFCFLKSKLIFGNILVNGFTLGFTL